MSLTLETGWIIATFLVATRLAGILLLTPVLGFSTIPVRIRLMFVLALSYLLLAGMGVSPAVSVPGSLVELVMATASELLLGAAMGFGILAVFGAFMFGGRVLDYQMGFGIATLFDPSSRVQSPLMGTLLSMLGAVLFLTLDAHHTLLRAVAYSLQVIPPGEGRAALAIGPLAAQFGLLFVYGVTLVAPAVFGLILLDVGIAFAARVMPQVNVYFVSLPAKVFLGLLLTALSLRFMEPFIKNMYDGIFRYWSVLLT